MYIFTAVNSGERCGPWASCFSIGYQIKAFYSMIIFVGAVKITDCENESWKMRIIHSKMFSLCFFTSDLLH